YMAVAATGCGREWEGRGHFCAAAPEAMRLILINRARDKGRMKHGGGLQRVDLDRVEIGIGDQTDGLDVLALDEALERLAAEEPECARLVKLRFFAGLTQEESAEVL